jgi:hypothetical protein
VINGFGIEELEISKELSGSMLHAFEQRTKRDQNGRFSTVEAGRKAAKTVDRQVHRGGQMLATGAGKVGMADKTAQNIEDHPYVSVVVAGVAARFGTKKAMDVWATGRLVFAKVGDISRVADDVTPTRHYSAVADQAEGGTEVMSNAMGGKPMDLPNLMFQGVRQKVTGKTQLPRARMEDNRWVGTNTMGRAFGADKTPAGRNSDLAMMRPYSPKSLQTLRGSNAQETLRNTERLIKGKNYESSFVLIDGELVSGMSGSWMMTGYVIPEGVKLSGKTVNFTHNHPAIVKSQSRSFSPGDFNVLSQLVKSGASKDSTLRAVYADGTVQEIVITDWGKYQRFNRVMNQAIVGRAVREGVKIGPDVELKDLLEVQAMIQSAANGKNGFVIREYSGFAKARTMSEAEIKRRKKAQGVVSRTTGTLGLTSLAAYGASKVPGTKLATKVPQLRRINSKKAKDLALGTSTAGAGIGGAGSFNFAAYTAAEGKKGQRVKKQWTPVSSNFNTERNRQKRNETYPKVAAGASAALGVGAGAKALRGVSLNEAASQAKKKKKAYKPIKDAAKARFKTSGKLGAAAAATGAAAYGLDRKNKSESWDVYKSFEPEGVFGEIGKSEDFEITKVGDWKTIDQRERTQRRDRKVQTAAGGAVGAGAGLAALGYNEGDRGKYRAGGRAIENLTNLKRRGEMSDKDYLKGTKNAVRTTTRSLSGKGKAGLALIGAGAAVGGAAKGQQSYQQHKINQRRRNNFKKSSDSAFGVAHD